MKELFELEWMGGPAEHHFRKARPGIDEMPWGTLDVSDYAPEVADAARATWTESAFTEYKAVAAFSDVLRLLCEAKAPLDLIGMASGFVADEIVHVELSSRMAMELGGAVPRAVDFEALYVHADPKGTAIQRCNEMIVRVSCVAEAYSGHMAHGALRGTTHPLTRAVLEKILSDEALHYRLGGLYLEWASEEMEDEERERLAQIATTTLKSIVPRKGPKKDAASAARYKATLEQVHEIGWVEARVFHGQVAESVREAIVKPLAKHGIVVPEEEVERMLA